jgi:protein-S-isoprenylcysteine O-methyltransferase Ste14
VTTADFALLLSGWVFWLIPFLRLKRSGGHAERIDRRARVGIVIVAVAYWLVYFQSIHAGPAGPLRFGISLVFFVLAGLLSWGAVRTLGRHWRIDAGLNKDHELVQTGSYRIVRHPIYLSMMCTLLGSGSLFAPIWILAIAIVIFLVGTEIRVRVEDALLASRFGEAFQNYRSRVKAYIPYVR